MTREEAKEILTHNWTRVDNPNYSESELDEAFFMAIEALKAEPMWNCTANFVAEQLDRLRKMTDEEKWEFFKKFFEIKGGDDE